MRLVVQRVSEASVKVDDTVAGAIGRGVLVLAGFQRGEDREALDWMAGKLLRLRIFDDDAGVMNRNVEDVGGEILLVSQFTLLGSTRKGNRPSWLNAAPPEEAEPLFNQFVAMIREQTSCPVATGRFGAHMEVGLINDGPVTLMIDSNLRE